MTCEAVLRECSEILGAAVQLLEAATRDSQRLNKIIAVEEVYQVKPLLAADVTDDTPAPEELAQRAVDTLREEQLVLQASLEEKARALQSSHLPAGGAVRRWQSQRIRQLQEEIDKL